MPKQRNLTGEAVMSAAADLVEEQGYYSLSLSNLANALGVKPPSLYNHVSGIEDVWKQLARVLLSRMEAAVQNAAVGQSKEAAVREIAHTYRRFAAEHGELYRTFTNAASIDGGAALNSLANTLRQVLKPYGLPPTRETDFIRIFHAGLHGFVALESAGFFKNADCTVDASFDALVDSQILILHNYRRKPQ
ncbi:TetR/AcrR family transcriptional regulator [Lachnospiraceae bacterium ZAX-1]